MKPMLRYLILAMLLAPEFLHAKEVSENAAVSGTVHYKGEVPQRAQPDNAGRRKPLLDVNDENAIQYAVVHLERIDDTPPEILKSEPPAETPTIDQEFYTFHPHVLAIQAGQTVAFTNSDTGENHNVHAIARNKENAFNTITPHGITYEHTFQPEPENRPIQLACDIHPWMRAWIYVFDHPRFAVTNADGQFKIENSVPGQYQLTIRQPDARLIATKKIAVEKNRRIATETTFNETHLGGKQAATIEIR